MIVGCAVSLGACVGSVGSAEEQLAIEDAQDVLRQDEGLKCKGHRGDVKVEIDSRRSLAITDQPILARFSFERVMKQLVKQSRARGLTPTALFQQWWDTQNPAPGFTDGPHCDDELDPELGPLLNGYPYTCRPAPTGEGKQAVCDPFSDDACRYIPVGLFNRFDLAAADGSDCGEHRIVYAKATGQTNNRDRNLLIFEATLPNPHPERGLEGCREIAATWASLSRIDSMKKRADLLEKFYFRGLGHGIGPVVDIDNYGADEDHRGQIRTNQFVQDGLEERAWSLREYKLSHVCARRRRGRHVAEECTLEVVPDTNKTNPFGPLFSEESAHPERGWFQEDFLTQVETLAANDLSAIAMVIDDRYNSGQSQASGSVETNYTFNFSEEGAFAAAIQGRLHALGAELSPADIVARAQTQSCAGCHRLSNDAPLGGGLTWPASAGFTHVDERETEEIDGVTRFVISPALTDVFLPHRKQVLEEFLAHPAPKKKHGSGRGHGRHHRSLGGSRSHG
jgi:hypothetical protein